MSSFKRKTKTASEEGAARPSEQNDLPASPTPSSPSPSPSSSSTDGAEMAPERISGQKAWMNTGSWIVSSGSRHLDEILGGGIPLGSSILYVTDWFSTHGSTLMAYHCAESLSHGHHTAVICPETTNKSFRALLPLNRNLDPEPESDPSTSQSTSGSGLVIAWQYEKYLNKMKEKTIVAQDQKHLPFCCSFDLSKRIQPSLEAELANLLLPSSWFALPLEERLSAILSQLTDYVTSIRQARPRATLRIFLPDFQQVFLSLPSSSSSSFSLSPTPSPSSLLARFLVTVKRWMWTHRVVVVLSVNPRTTPPGLLQTLEQAMDTVLAIESFTGRMHAVPYEFDRFHAFLVLHKVQQSGMLAPMRASSSRYGMIRDRRKLHIEPLHLPPEESRAFGSTEAAGGGSCATSKPPIVRSNAQGENAHGCLRGEQHDHRHEHSPAARDEVRGVPAPSTAIPSAGSAGEAGMTAAASTRSSSLASSLAAARAARMAGGTAAVISRGQPISISGRPLAHPPPAPKPPSLDF